MTLWIDFLGSEIRWLDAAGVPTRLVTKGADGPPLVLMHGRGGHLESWRANLAPLAERFRVSAFDLLGHGLTGRRDCDYGVAELTEHAVVVLERLDLGPVTLVGQSLGGWVAVRIALTRPDLVRSLVLVEPAGLQSEAERLADPKVAVAFERGGRAFDAPTAETVRTRLEGLLADPDAVDEELVDLRLALYASGEARAVHRFVRAADNTDVLLTPQALSQLDLPVTLIHGELANTPGEVVEAAARAAGARLVVASRVKQWPQLENPPLVNELISAQADL